MSAEVINLAARRHPQPDVAPAAPAPDELAGWESERQFVGRMFDNAHDHMQADDLPLALLSVEMAARALRWLLDKGLATEELERAEAIKTRRRMAAAEKGAETRARNRMDGLDGRK